MVSFELVQTDTRQNGGGIENLDRSIELNPDYPDAYRYKAEALRALGKDGLAEISLKKAIELEV